jgi:hypothetical protein
MHHEAPSDVKRGQSLLGGWRDLMDGLLGLQRKIAAADGHCQCGHAAGANVGCPCCERAARDLAAVCEACRHEIGAVAERVDRVEEDALRFLPAFFELFARTPERYGDAVTVQHSLTQLLLMFRHLQAATGEWTQGCRTTHLPEVKARAEDVAIACRRFDDALRPIR